MLSPTKALGKTLIGHGRTLILLRLRNGRHQLFSLHCPVNEQLCLFPACIHRLALQDDYDEEVTVFLEAAGQTCTSCLRDTCFHPCEPVDAEEAVRVHPVVCVFILFVYRLIFLLLRLLGRFIRATGSRSVCCLCFWFRFRLLAYHRYGSLNRSERPTLVCFRGDDFPEERDLHTN